MYTQSHEYDKLMFLFQNPGFVRQIWTCLNDSDDIWTSNNSCGICNLKQRLKCPQEFSTTSLDITTCYIMRVNAGQTRSVSRWDLTRGMCSPRGGYGNAVLDAQECQVPLGINCDIILSICRCSNHLHEIRVRVLLFVPNDVGITAWAGRL